MPKQRRLCDDSDDLPGDDIRCRRTDGRGWRCAKRATDGVNFCEHHYHQIRRNIEKHKHAAPKRKRRAVVPTKQPDPPAAKRVKKEDPPTEELITTAPKRRMKQKREKGREKSGGDAEDPTTRVLPNGLMTIAPSPVGGLCNEGSSLDRKVGFDEDRLLTRRCIRSKNAEPIPLATLKKVPCGRGLGMGRKRVCHRCDKKKVERMVRCLSCKKMFFCSGCIKKRYSGMSEEEVNTACPVCRGCCDCETCSLIGAKDGGCKENANDQNKFRKTDDAKKAEMFKVEAKVAYPDCDDSNACCPIGAEDGSYKELANCQNKFNKTEQAYNLISQLLPLLKNIYQKQLGEVETKEPDQGGRFSGILLQVDEPHNELVNCNYCRISLVDFHRSCSRCSYRLCISCYRKILKGSFSQVTTTDTFKSDESKRAHKRVIKELNGMKRILSTGVRPDNSSLSTVLASEIKENSESNISCPPKEFGGCGNGLLKLMFTVPFGWSKDLGKTAEEVAFSNDCLHNLRLNPHCSSPVLENQKVGQFNISVQEASDR
ncbi:hypothetical protein Cni_G00591 [Canna indica]|uniref:Uncharacterized protein n=1 Tax=Canna indica TaxID=4628 RepID=A0AAQ3PZR0_9LILI|nr:hypothetical protein Cni_G00591 [Canna indica]